MEGGRNGWGKGRLRLTPPFRQTLIGVAGPVGTIALHALPVAVADVRSPSRVIGSRRRWPAMMRAVSTARESGLDKAGQSAVILRTIPRRPDGGRCPRPAA